MFADILLIPDGVLQIWLHFILISTMRADVLEQNWGHALGNQWKSTTVILPGFVVSRSTIFVFYKSYDITSNDTIGVINIPKSVTNNYITGVKSNQTYVSPMRSLSVDVLVPACAISDQLALSRLHCYWRRSNLRTTHCVFHKYVKSQSQDPICNGHYLNKLQFTSESDQI